MYLKKIILLFITLGIFSGFLFAEETLDLTAQSTVDLTKYKYDSEKLAEAFKPDLIAKLFNRVSKEVQVSLTDTTIKVNNYEFHSSIWTEKYEDIKITIETDRFTTTTLKGNNNTYSIEYKIDDAYLKSMRGALDRFKNEFLLKVRQILNEEMKKNREKQNKYIATILENKSNVDKQHFDTLSSEISKNGDSLIIIQDAISTLGDLLISNQKKMIENQDGMIKMSFIISLGVIFIFIIIGIVVKNGYPVQGAEFGVEIQRSIKGAIWIYGLIIIYGIFVLYHIYDIYFFVNYFGR